MNGCCMIQQDVIFHHKKTGSLLENYQLNTLVADIKETAVHSMSVIAHLSPWPVCQ